MPFGFLPQIDLDAGDKPHLFYTSNLARFVGHYVTRSDAGEWTIEDVDTGDRGSNDFFLNRDDVPTLLASDFIGHTSLWQRTTTWRVLEDIDGVVSVGGFGVTQRDSAGCIHSLAQLYDGLAYARRVGTWGFEKISTPGAIDVHQLARVALSAEGRPHVVFSETLPVDGWILRWVAPPLPPETVPSEGLQGGTGFLGALAVAPGDPSDAAPGVPHLLLDVTMNGAPAIEYARRRSAGNWLTLFIDSNSPGPRSFAEACGETHGGFPTTCTYRNETLRALTGVASGVDVRLFYARVINEVRGHATCHGCLCSWEYDGSVPVAGTLEVAWPDGDDLRSAVVAQGGIYNGSQAVIGAGGRIHMVLADSMGGLKYVQVGAFNVATPTPTVTARVETPSPSGGKNSGIASSGCQTSPTSDRGTLALLLSAGAVLLQLRGRRVSRSGSSAVPR